MIDLLQYKNGLRVCVDNMPVRSVMTGIWVGAGSKYEDMHNNGISHFTEHVLFKGTDKMSPSDIANAFEGYGAMINAFTSKESTCYYYKCVDKYNEDCFKLLCDIFFHSTFPKEELDKERNVIIEEINMVEDAPDEICSDLLFRAAFGNKSLGQTILGPKANVQRFTGDDVREYRKCAYTADNIVIVFAGNITVEQADNLVKQYAFCELNDNRKSIKCFDDIFSANKQEYKIKDFEQSNIVLAYPSVVSGDDEKIAVQSVLSCLFGGCMSSRLFQSVREQQGLAYSIYTSPSAYANAGLFTICLNNSPNNSVAALTSVKHEIDKLITDGITDEELCRAKVQLVSSLAFAEENVQSHMISQGKSLVCNGKPYDINRKIELMESVSRDDVLKFARDVFDSKKLTAAYVGKTFGEDILNIMK